MACAMGYLLSPCGLAISHDLGCFPGLLRGSARSPTARAVGYSLSPYGLAISHDLGCFPGLLHGSTRSPTACAVGYSLSPSGLTLFRPQLPELRADTPPVPDGRRGSRKLFPMRRYPSAFPRSAMMSSRSSMPTETRSSDSVTPISDFIGWGTSRCEEIQG